MTNREFTIDSTNRVRQVSKRAAYDRATVFKILDANLIGNVGFILEERPFVIPMLYARVDDQLLFHGSTKSRLMKMLCSGLTICVSVTQLDGLVLAKSLFHHSMNYQSVCVYGRGSEVTGESDRLEALKTISDKTMPGRWQDARQPNANELKATSIAAVKIEKASAKIRSGPPVDDAVDMKLPVWSGVVPIASRALPVIATPADCETQLPKYVEHWISELNQFGDKV